jgi:SsrA-binding protein
VKESRKTLAENRKARHDYFIEDRFEAGIALSGTEVKSVRAGSVGLKDAYATVINGEMFLRGMHISPYEKGNIFNKDPLRLRKLLLHKREINRLYGRVKLDGYALIPLSVYLKGPYVKIDLGLCKGKQRHDKRDAAAQRDAGREMERAMKERVNV